MPKAKPSPLGFPKPHYLAHVAETPCRRCGYDWLRPAVVLDPETEELPLVDVCARCGADPAKAPATAGHGVEEPGHPPPSSQQSASASPKRGGSALAGTPVVPHPGDVLADSASRGRSGELPPLS